MTSGATACTATTRTTWKVMKRRTSLTGHAARCCGRRCELLKGSPMPRPVSLVPTTLAVGFLVLCGLTRSDAQTGLPAASTHRLTQRRADLEQRLQRLVGMAETGHYDKGVSPDGVRTETTYIQRRLKEGDFRVGDRILLVVEDPEPPATGAGTPVVKSSEQQLSDTFTVGSSQELTLPVVGVVSLRGVLRTELEPRPVRARPARRGAAWHSGDHLYADEDHTLTRIC